MGDLLVAEARGLVVEALRASHLEGEARALARATLDPRDHYGCLYRTLLVVEPTVRLAARPRLITALATLRFCAARAGEGAPDTDKIALMLIKETLSGTF